MTHEWLTAGGNTVTTATFEEVLSDTSASIHVGSDSHYIGGEWIFATVVCAYREGKGGNFFYRRRRLPKSAFRNLYDRLMQEVSFSIEAAEELKASVKREPSIHLDVNWQTTATARLMPMLTSYVKSMGYDTKVKPDAWASSSIADKKAR
jgi:predicted RNase H-related nuclease YkuK (DUF458 family)